jgi:succinoglycan biosynthesis protein ExoV
MKLYYYRGKTPNFGDELNTWLMPRVFPDFFDNDDSSIFLAIGSVIFDHHKATSQKVVFGSGYGGYTPLPVLDRTWKFYCVRGPRTAQACGLDASKVAGDTAILVHDYRPRQKIKSIGCSFIPHWESISRGNWRMACDLAGIHFIDPGLSVETVMETIEASEMIITEAMHGAIVSDALRVPWVSMLPIHASHRWKWYDWAGALDLKIRPERLFPSSTREACLALFHREAEMLDRMKFPWRPLKRATDWAFVRAAAHWLKAASRLEPNLSRDTSFGTALERLQTNAEAIKRDFGLQERKSYGP